MSEEQQDNILTAKERIVVGGMAISATNRYPVEPLAMLIAYLVMQVADDDPRFDTIYDVTEMLVALMDKAMRGLQLKYHWPKGD